MLTLSGVEKGFAGEAALAPLDLRLPPGEFLVVLGPSGCGKTTLLRLAAGALQPDRGRIENSFARTAMVFQDARLLPWSDAVDNAAFGLKARGIARAERRARAREWLLRLGLTPADLGKRATALSGGMRQRVAVARALATGPDLLLMDEPFAALDVGLRQHMQDLVRAQTRPAGIAALFVTHDVAEAVRLASRILVLSPRPGRVVADLPNIPPDDPAAVLDAAAALLRRPVVAAALHPPHLTDATDFPADPGLCARCDAPVCRTP